jgi:hypothetical protein
MGLKDLGIGSIIGAILGALVAWRVTIANLKTSDRTFILEAQKILLEIDKQLIS